MFFTDTHTHIYSNEFDHDRSDMMARAAVNGVTRLLLPAIDSGWHEKMLETAAAYPGICFPMMGLHPPHFQRSTGWNWNRRPS